MNAEGSDVRQALAPTNEDVATLKLCGAAAEALIAVLSDVLDLRYVARTAQSSCLLRFSINLCNALISQQNGPTGREPASSCIHAWWPFERSRRTDVDDGQLAWRCGRRGRK